MKRALAELAEKYRELERLKGLPRSSDRAEWRQALRELASRFPGALKELEKLSLEEVVRRRVAVEAECASANAHDDLSYLEHDERRWMPLAVEFHRLTRKLLAAKRVVGAFASAQTLAQAGLALDEAELDALVAPPDGRLTHAVYALLAARFRLPAEQIHREIFPGVPYGKKEPA